MMVRFFEVCHGRTISTYRAVLAFGLVLGWLGGSTAVAAPTSSAAAPTTLDPQAHIGALYAFVSPDDTSTVTMIVDTIPFEAPASGPSFYGFDDDVLYEIRIDTTGDSIPDVGFQFRFTTATQNPGTFLYATGPILSPSDPNWSRLQTFTVTVVHFDKKGKIQSSGNKKPVVLGTALATPPNDVGPRTTPNYDGLSAAAVTDFGTIKVFAGQRDEPFFADLGALFDLVGLRPFNPFHLLPLGASAGVDALASYNTHSIAIQVPIVYLVEPPSTTIGIYASTSRQKTRVLKPDGTVTNRGAWVQVSRVGNPLVDELVIPLGQKAAWNRASPWGDSQFESDYTSPVFAATLNALYGAPPAGHPGGAFAPIDTTGRDDLKTILLTGAPGINFTGTTDADLLRLNTALKPGSTASCAGGPNRLGALAGDFCGFPNGRRLGDDVVDIQLRAFAQGYGSALNGTLAFPNKSPNNILGDGVDVNDVPFSNTFPYVASPHQGYQVP